MYDFFVLEKENNIRRCSSINAVKRKHFASKKIKENRTQLSDRIRRAVVTKSHPLTAEKERQKSGCTPPPFSSKTNFSK